MNKIKVKQSGWRDTMMLPPIKLEGSYHPSPPKGNKSVKYTEHKNDIMKDLGLGKTGKAEPKSNRKAQLGSTKAPRGKGSLKKHTGKAVTKLHNRHGN